MVNPTTLISRTIVQELIAVGVTDVVLAPGSRSAGLALATAQADKAGAIQLHVRIDEREAGFLALGIAKATRNAVAIIVTSGTAVANLLPAVIEAYYSGVSLIVISADRPASSRNRMSPQTINQAGIFSDFVAATIDLAINPNPHELEQMHAAVNSARLLRRLPVHINVQCDMPLVPDSSDVTWVPEPFSQSHQSEQYVDTVEPTREHRELPAHGVIIAGDITRASDALHVGQLAEQLGWPVLWEPSAKAHALTNAVAHGPLLVDNMPDPDAVLTIGTVGLSRSIMGLLRRTPLHISVHLPSNAADAPDPVGTAHEILDALPTVSGQPDPKWLAMWRRVEAQTESVVAQALTGNVLSGPRAARLLWEHAANSDQLFVASSWPVRHIEAYAPCRDGLTVFGNRGANGIDGLISTAWGTACGNAQRTYLLIGDVAFLHGASGLNVADDEVRPNLTIVVLDNDGGGIFSQLEQGAPEFDEHFDKVFGTPHGRDLWVIAESYGVAATRVTNVAELERALAATDRIAGVHVIVCTTGSRRDEFALMQGMKNSVADVLA